MHHFANKFAFLRHIDSFLRILKQLFKLQFCYASIQLPYYILQYIQRAYMLYFQLGDCTKYLTIHQAYDALFLKK
ncbi:hypothetical protein LWI29_006078 [Acer saccharum]|uniref:Uncharacterized protein n=1 Tax=Acer saccharum TaxID=4024 RepID=A0AA39RU67_ACESA|nr:hypothetical protein LWI29_006078 [Acer saccharum]